MATALTAMVVVMLATSRQGHRSVGPSLPARPALLPLHPGPPPAIIQHHGLGDYPRQHHTNPTPTGPGSRRGPSLVTLTGPTTA